MSCSKTISAGWLCGGCDSGTGCSPAFWRRDSTASSPPGRGPRRGSSLAARAIQLTSARFRADLAASLRGLLAAAGAPQDAGSTGIAGGARQAAGAPGRFTASRRHLQTPRRPGDRPSHGVRTAAELALLAGAGRSRWPAAHGSPAAASRPRIPVCRARIRRSAAELADLAARLAAPGPLPARGVAMVGQLVTDGLGPLYRPACPEDLGAVIAGATRALAS